jgi:hypothetical protein
MILDLSVPMDGKYIPTQASNAKKAAMRAARFELPVTAATPIETAAAAVMAAVLVSTFTLRDCRAPEKCEVKVRVGRVGFRREKRKIANIAATRKEQYALPQCRSLTESRRAEQAARHEAGKHSSEGNRSGCPVLRSLDSSLDGRGPLEHKDIHRA